MGKTNPDLDVTGWRFRDDSVGLTTDSGWHAAENTTADITVDTVFRLVVGIEEIVGGNDNGTGSLEYSHEGGSFTAVPTSAGSPVYSTLSSQFADADANNSGTTQLLSGATQTTQNGEGDEQSNAVTGVGSNTYKEYEFALQIDSTQVADNDTIDFQWASTTSGITYTDRVGPGGGMNITVNEPVATRRVIIT